MKMRHQAETATELEATVGFAALLSEAAVAAKRAAESVIAEYEKRYINLRLLIR